MDRGGSGDFPLRTRSGTQFGNTADTANGVPPPTGKGRGRPRQQGKSEPGTAVAATTVGSGVRSASAGTVVVEGSPATDRDGGKSEPEPLAGEATTPAPSPALTTLTELIQCNRTLPKCGIFCWMSAWGLLSRALWCERRQRVAISV